MRGHRCLTSTYNTSSAKHAVLPLAATMTDGQMTAAARTQARRQTTIGPEQQTVGVLPEGESPRVALAKTSRTLTQISPTS